MSNYKVTYYVHFSRSLHTAIISTTGKGERGREQARMLLENEFDMVQIMSIQPA